MIEEGLVTYLSADSGVAAIAGDRIYINHLPQEPTFPAITFSNISSVPYMTISEKGSMDRSRFQIDAWSQDPVEAKTLSNAIRAALEGYRGMMGNETVKAVIPIELGMDDFDDVTVVFRIMSEYYILHGV